MHDDNVDGVVVDLPDDIKPGDTVEVDLEPKKPEAKKVSKEPQYVSVDELQKIQKQMNGLSAATRNFEKATREIAELKQVLQSSTATRQEKSAAKDELDQLLETDWKSAVRRLAHEEATQMFQQKQQEDYQRSLQQEQTNTLELSKQAVYSKYPELHPSQGDPDSEIFKAYVQTMNENPGFLRNINGPELCMYKMEEKLRASGRADRTTAPIIEKEALRLARTGATRAPAGGRNTTGNKVILSKEQKEFCDHHGISYDSYARNLSAGNKKEGVEA